MTSCRGADDALTEKRTATENADKLINLDAMKIQIGNIRQQYLQKLVVVDEPDIDTVTMSRSAVCHTMKLQSEADIDEYIAEVKKDAHGQAERSRCSAYNLRRYENMNKTAIKILLLKRE